jgi:hypothetical protein
MKTSIHRHWLAIAGFVALAGFLSNASAQVTLGTAQTYGVLGGSAVTNTGPSVINGDLGLSPGSSVTGFPPGLVTGTTNVANAAAVTAQNDVTIAYNFLASQPCSADLTGTDLGGLTLTPGIYCFSSSAQLTGTLTLDAQGNANAVFIFRIGSTLTTAVGSSVALINGANACNVWWQVGSSATLGTTTAFQGSVLALTSITLNTGATLAGRALARNGAVTLDTNTISVPMCAAPPPPPTIAVTKVSNGGVGSFSFTGSNGFTGQTITTVTTGVGVTGATQTLAAANLVTTITESAPPAGFTLASISCSGLGAGGTALYNLATRTVTLDAAATATGSSIACTFTNAFGAAPVLPTVTLTKVSVGGVGSFSFTGSNGFAAQTIATVASGLGVAGAAQTLTAAGVVTTLTESAPPAGFALASISCSGLGAGGTFTSNLATRTVTLDAAATAAGSTIACTFTNVSAASVLPTVTLTKVSNGAVGSFSFTGSNGFAGQTITTTAPGVGVAGATLSLTAAGVVTTLTESAPPAGFALASISCSGLGAGGTLSTNLATRTVTLDAAATAAGSAIACTFTNTAAVGPPPGPVTPAAIPTLSEWAMILLAALLAMAGFAAIRRRSR